MKVNYEITTWKSDTGIYHANCSDGKDAVFDMLGRTEKEAKEKLMNMLKKEDPYIFSTLTSRK